MRVLVVGVGAVGGRAARQLAASTDVELVLVSDRDAERAESVAASLGDAAEVADDPVVDVDADVVIVAIPAGSHADITHPFVRRGVPVVSTSDAIGDVRKLLAMDAEATAHDVPVVLGAGFSPGLSCLLARHGASAFDAVHEIHVAKLGTGGPACARQHHKALGSAAVEWLGGQWEQRGGGSGRELCWFPDPVASADCYRGALAEPLLLVPAFPEIDRVTSRMAATRLDRLTSRLPMLSPPHPEGGLGAIRLELRGELGGESSAVVYGAVDHPAIAAGAVAAVAALSAAAGDIEPGARGLATLGHPLATLDELHRRGVRAAVFEGLAF